MNNFEEERLALLEARSRYKANLQENLQEASGQARKTGERFLWIAGGAVVTFGLVSLLFGFFGRKESEEVADKKGKKKADLPASTQDSYIVRMIKQEIARFILSIARQKLNEFMAAQAAAKLPKDKEA